MIKITDYFELFTKKLFTKYEIIAKHIFRGNNFGITNKVEGIFFWVGICLNGSFGRRDFETEPSQMYLKKRGDSKGRLAVS